ncbi:MAG: ribonuclease P protein component [Oscillospiraceae bacterium]|nr:ribonuclease P protein component [Oscillospiraceae bacterium]MBR6695229.1 ribonuclease P protein component [Oscillospiraceae bacterium]
MRSFFFKIMQKKEIIKDNKVFLRLYKRGKYIIGKTVVVYFRKNGTTENRVGITTTKKVGNSVKRSRARRVIRAAYDSLRDKFPKGYDYIFVARQAAAEVKSYQIATFFEKRAIPFIEEGGVKKNG